jgi:nicotinate-nucleotide--dimethylbenzimidazole phosphoribosyltransferase
MVNQDLSLEEVVAAIVPIDRGWIEKAQARTAELVMPTRALGRLHDLAERLCCIQKSLVPAINSKAVLVMAGDHGIVADGVSAYPQEVTGAMVRTFLAGGAAINVVTRQIGAEVWVVDLGIIPDLDPSVMEGGNRFLVRKIASGTDNFLKGSAMSREAALQAVMTGFEIAPNFLNRGSKLLGLVIWVLGTHLHQLLLARL